MAMVMARHHSALKQRYRYLISRTANPLKKKQALIVISKKAVTNMIQIIKTNAAYRSALVPGQVRRQQLGLAA